MNPVLVGRVLLPLKEKLAGRDTFVRLKELEAAERCPASQLRAVQLEKLRKLLRHCEARVPYYRDLFRKNGIVPDEIRDPGDFGRVPLLTKPVVRQELKRLAACSWPVRPLPRVTSGSSGEPLAFYVDPARVACDVAATWRILRAEGVAIGARGVIMRGPFPYRPWSKGWGDLLLNVRLFSAADMSFAQMERFAGVMRRFKPRYILGYPSAVYRFCVFLNERGYSSDEFGVRVVLSVSEALHDFQREAIVKTLGCRAVNIYSSLEAGMMASECPEGKMHVSQNVYLETVAAQTPVPNREIVVTHLESYGMPFLRYRTGDLGILREGACSCGRPTPVLERLEGRVADFILTPDGGAVHALVLFQALNRLKGASRIAQLRVVQKAATELEVWVVAPAALREAIGREIVAAFSRILGPRVRVRPVFVEEIRSGPGGKARPFVSELPGSAQR